MIYVLELSASSIAAEKRPNPKPPKMAGFTPTLKPKNYKIN
jgi:hypothetical protein